MKEVPFVSITLRCRKTQCSHTAVPNNMKNLCQSVVMKELPPMKEFSPVSQILGKEYTSTPTMHDACYIVKVGKRSSVLEHNESHQKHNPILS